MKIKRIKRTIVFGALVLILAAFGMGCGNTGGDGDEIDLLPPPEVVPGPEDDDDDDGDGDINLPYDLDPGEYDLDPDDPDNDDPDNNDPEGDDPEDDDDQDGDLDDDGIPDEEDDDADGDGFDSDADCDDSDPDIYPGAPDKPDFPDYTDSNCDGVDGDLRGAVWVSADGKDINPGTMEHPFKTIQLGILVAKADLNDVKDVYVADGVYFENAILDEGVGLYGGYGPLNEENLRDRDLNVYQPQHVSSVQPFRIESSSTGAESVVEGMMFIGVVDNSAVKITNASPVIRHSKIYGANSGWRSIGVEVIARGGSKRAKPYLLENLIQSGRASKAGGLSVAIYAHSFDLSDLVELVLKDNDIKSATAGYGSFGVSIFAGNLAWATLLAYGNDVEVASADVVTGGIMMGYDVFEAASMKFTRAEVFRNTIHGGFNAMFSFGVVVEEATHLVTLKNNFITGGYDSTQVSTGIFVEESSSHILNNTINAGSSELDAISITLDENAQTKIDNNILHAEDGEFMIGIDEDEPTSTPSSLRNNLFADVLSTKYYDFVNGHILNVAAVNAQADIADLRDNIGGDAGFEDLASFDYHLLGSSDAIDAGLDDVTVIDIDGDLRPEGDATDIGADEFVE